MSSTLGSRAAGFGSKLATQHNYDCRDRSLLPTASHGQARGIWFEGGLPTPPSTKIMTGITASRSYLDHSAQEAYTNGYSNGHGSAARHSRIPSDPYPLMAPSRSVVQDTKPAEQTNNNIVAAYLQIPESINNSKGSIAEFAAEITCLFWFETAATIKYAEELPLNAPTDRGLVFDAVPATGFRKWVTMLLTTTQVGQNVILLALMFVYRLKKFNPSVSGKRGSEYRLLTIALMLGNKFLDDNTYTNKTWAEVSGISVTEIHIMEVEFLSNMRYELYASKADWARWKALLGRFSSFYEKASRFQAQSSPDSKPPITPINQISGYKLPSPPSQQNGLMRASQATLPNPLTTLPQLTHSPVRPQSHSVVPFERKRSVDVTDYLPPAKRPHLGLPVHNLPTAPELGPLLVNEPRTASRLPQLPMPRLTTSNTTVGPYSTPISLPPTRAMATVYPLTTSGWSQPVTPMSATPVNIPGQYQNLSSFPLDNIRPQSHTNSANTSPINMYGTATPTRPGLSPSYFLTNRSSPYKPVRHVRTLLDPPPSAAMQNSAKSIGFDQMHYQPLGRPTTDRRSGPVPYLLIDPRQQSAASTPTGIYHRAF